MGSDMAWVGNWRNQFGSILRITDDANGRIAGNFETALEDSGFYGQAVPITGFHKGNCIAFVAVGSSATGDRAVSYTGLLRHGKMETAWFVIADQALSAAREGEPAKLKPQNWWRAVTSNVDTFERSYGHS
ncbi:avidin/streptavidin family protein [Bradyrhizobium sp. BR 1432]|uniref:avidin/streptavidin family protein n=1 Tax=Bradyrhizobium sp. BR 1432 TaxID=3447966 RepID=UPI003EE5DF9D